VEGSDTFHSVLPRLPAWLGCAVIAASLACAHGAGRDRLAWDFFRPAGGEDDPWQRKVAGWQERSQEQAAEPLLALAGAGPTPLADKLTRFELEERRVLAQRIQAWSRWRAREHYRKDGAPDPAHDHWPTADELLAFDGDDCDGLDLIAYRLLREFGFPADEVYRVIVRRDRDGSNHMATLWFEDPRDPWVLDVTGAMSRGLERFSRIEGWTPTKIFNETHQFSVGKKGPRFVAAGSD
jgi:hypothetical protein